MRRLFLSTVLLLGTLALAASPTTAEETKSSQVKVQGKAYDLLRTKSDKHEMADAYLLAYASCYVFPELIGFKNRNDHKGFAEKFAARFLPLGVKRVKYVSDERTSTEVVVLTTDAAVIVVFRGSEFSNTNAMIKDWLTNVNAIMTGVPEMGRGAKVHRGMWKSVDSVFDDVVKEIAAQEGFGKKRVYVTGHSLGGGLALVCGVRLHKEDKGRPVIYTFGSPRVGNHEFRRAANDLIVHRWVYAKDVVCMMPSDRVLDYRHVGQTHNITKRNHVYHDDSELRAIVGSAGDHHVYYYLAGLHANLPEELKSTLPEPPG